MTLRVSDWQSESDLNSISNSCNIFLKLQKSYFHRRKTTTYIMETWSGHKKAIEKKTWITENIWETCLLRPTCCVWCSLEDGGVVDALGNGISRGSLGASLDSITNQKELMQHSLKSTTSKRDRLKHPRRCLNIAKEIRLRGDETSLIYSFLARL